MARIKLGICLKSLGLPFRRSLPLAQALGASGVELEAAGELLPQSLTQTGRREITHLLRSHDLSVSAISCPLRRGLDDPQDLEPRLEQIRLAMALAFDLGPRLVIIQPGRICASPLAGRASGGMADPSLARPANTVNLMHESVNGLGKHGDRTGVMVALDAGLDDPTALVEYLDRLDAGSLAISFNPANLVLNGFNPHDAVKTFHRRMAHAHAQDARRISPSKLAVPVGHGDIDWLQLLADFEAIDYRGFFTVLGDGRADLAGGLAFLRRFLA